MIRRKAACASGVTVSASSKMIILKGGLGYLEFSDDVISSSSSFFLVVPKKDRFLEDAASVLPTAKPAKCLILSRTTEMPRSSLAFNSKTRRFHCDGCHSCRQSAKATEVCIVQLVQASKQTTKNNNINLDTRY